MDRAVVMDTMKKNMHLIHVSIQTVPRRKSSKIQKVYCKVQLMAIMFASLPMDRLDLVRHILFKEHLSSLV